MELHKKGNYLQAVSVQMTTQILSGFKMCESRPDTPPVSGCAWVPGGSCLLEARQQRHLDNCLCNDLDARWHQINTCQTTSKDPLMSEQS
eukprot:3440148-Prymnesium_polylepis.2